MKRILILTTIMIMVAAPTIMAQGPMGGKGMPPHPGMGQRGFDGHGGGRGQFDFINCKNELNLSDEQIDKINSLNFEHRNLMIDLKADLEKAKLAKRHELRADNPDKSKVLQATGQMSEIKAKMAEMRVNHRFDMRDVLTKEQLDKWKECRQDCRKGGRDFRGRGHDGKGGFFKSGKFGGGNRDGSRFGG